jgi:hypothetical protein
MNPIIFLKKYAILAHKACQKNCLLIKGPLNESPFNVTLASTELKCLDVCNTYWFI